MFINPQTVINRIPNIQDGLIVGDFGSSTGEYSLEVANRMQGKGRVYAMDVQKPLLDRLQNQASKAGIENLFVVWTDLEQLGVTKVPEHSVDVGILANILFQIDDKYSFGNEVARLLKPGAQIIIVDWLDSFGGLGPQPDDVFNDAQAVAWCEGHNFSVSSLEKDQEHHYVIIARNEN